MTALWRPWKPAEDALLREHWPAVADIMSGTGRSHQAVINRGKRLGFSLPRGRKTNPRVEAAVLRDWHVKHPNDIARELRVDKGTVYAAARNLGLGDRRSPTLPKGPVQLPVPDRPRGYSKAEIAWARKNQHRSREAGLILVHHADAA